MLWCGGGDAGAGAGGVGVGVNGVEDHIKHAVACIEAQPNVEGPVVGVVVVEDAVNDVGDITAGINFEHHGPVLVVYSAGAYAGVSGTQHWFDMQTVGGVILRQFVNERDGFLFHTAVQWWHMTGPNDLRHRRTLTFPDIQTRPRRRGAPTQPGCRLPAVAPWA